MRQRIAILVLFLTLLAPVYGPAQQPTSPPPEPQAAQAKAPTPSSPSQGNPDVRVWVNTHSGVYHCPGTHWYGATKSGTYMKQSEARQKRYRPAYHRVCK
jgi:hypothetical protein